MESLPSDLDAIINSGDLDSNISFLANMESHQEFEEWCNEAGSDGFNQWGTPASVVDTVMRLVDEDEFEYARSAFIARNDLLVANATPRGASLTTGPTLTSRLVVDIDARTPNVRRMIVEELKSHVTSDVLIALLDSLQSGGAMEKTKWLEEHFLMELESACCVFYERRPSDVKEFMYLWLTRRPPIIWQNEHCDSGYLVSLMPKITVDGRVSIGGADYTIRQNLHGRNVFGSAWLAGFVGMDVKPGLLPAQWKSEIYPMIEYAVDTLQFQWVETFCETLKSVGCRPEKKANPVIVRNRLRALARAHGKAAVMGIPNLYPKNVDMQVMLQGIK